MSEVEVYIQDHPYPLVLEEDERLDLSPLQLQPATNVIQGKAGLVGRDGCTKRKWGSLILLLGTPAGAARLGTVDNPLQVSGAGVTGRPMCHECF